MSFRLSTLLQQCEWTEISGFLGNDNDSTKSIYSIVFSFCEKFAHKFSAEFILHLVVRHVIASFQVSCLLVRYIMYIIPGNPRIT